MQKLFFLFALIIIFVFGFQYLKAHTSWFDTPTAYAVGDLTVNWGVPEGTPLFTISDGSPGQIEKRTVSIKNAGTQIRQIGIKGDKSNENKNMSDALEMKITENGNDVYGGTQGKKTLRNFLAESSNLNGLPLGNLPPSSIKNLDITLTFDKNSGNEYQNATITFNLFVGIQTDIPAACEGMNLDPKTIFGTEGNDKITGGSKNELIVTLGGDDNVVGGSGNDCIVTGNGNSKIDAGSGNDTIKSGSGNNTIDGGSGNDDIVASGGNNTLDGGSGNDNLNNGSATNGKADGGSGLDTCIAKAKSSCEK